MATPPEIWAASTPLIQTSDSSATARWIGWPKACPNNSQTGTPSFHNLPAKVANASMPSAVATPYRPPAMPCESAISPEPNRKPMP